jgi:hypothetical protein
MTTITEIAIEGIRILAVISIFIYGIKVMKEVNTDYQHSFGLGIIILFSSLLSLFKDEWIRTANTFLWCVALYFFIRILKEKIK